MADYINQLLEQADTSGFTDASGIVNNVNDQPEPERPVVEQTESSQVAGQGSTQVRKPDVSGIDKFLEENIQIPLADFIDNTFQGDQKSPDDIARERAAARQQWQQREQETREQMRQNPLGEPIRVGVGAVTGVAETALNAAELVGDLAKQGLGRSIAPIFPALSKVLTDERQNPFSNKYEWAIWDLGRNEKGANTPIGRIAQGFLEFGLTAALTGGFRGLAGAGQLMAQGGLRSVGRFGAQLATPKGFGVMARAGAVGALAGIPADLIQATRGEGNLSNLIKKEAPDWYPTWLTALAVDEDDSAAEAMFKTALEGATLGFAADAVGAYLAGVRATRQALKAGMDEAAAGAFGEEQARIATELTLPRQVDDVDAPQSVLEAPASPAEAAVRGTPADPAEEASEALLEAPSSPRTFFTPEEQETLQNLISSGNFQGSELVERLRELSPRNQARALRETLGDDRAAERAAAQIGLGPAAQLFAFGPSRHGHTFRQGAEASWQTRLPNGAEINWTFDTMERNGRQMVDVSWSEIAHENIGLYGRYGITDFQRIARDMPEGTILTNFPVNDNYGRNGPSAAQLRRTNQTNISSAYREWVEGAEESYIAYLTRNNPGTEDRAAELWENADFSRRESWARLLSQENRYTVEPPTPLPPTPLRGESARARLYRRAGFGSVQPGGRQFAVVRGTPSGNRRWLEPIEDINNTQAVDDLINQQLSFVERTYREGANYAQMRGWSEGLTGLREQAARGIPVTWDDVASTTTEYFTTGNRALQAVDEVRVPVRFTQPQLNFLRRYANDGTNLLRNTELSRTQIDNYIQRITAELESNQEISANLRRSLTGLLGRLAEAGAQAGDAVQVPRAAADMPPGFADDVIRRLNTEEEFTTNPFTGQDPTSGYAVAIDGETLIGTDPDDIASFIGRNEDILSRDDAFIGSWYNANGERVIEISRVVQDPDEARYLGYLYDQEAIFDVANRQNIPTYGTDQLKNTKGQHLAPVMGAAERVMDTPTVDSTTAAIQRLSGDTVDLDGAGRMQPTVTQAQLRLLSNAVNDEEAVEVLRTMVRENPIDLDTLTAVSRRTEAQVLDEAGEAITAALGGAGRIDFDQIRRLELADGDVLLSRAGIVQVRGLMAELSQRLFDNAYETLRRGDANIDQLPVVRQLAEDMKGLLRIHKASAHAYGNLLKSYQLPIPGLESIVERLVRPNTTEEIAQHIRNADKLLDDLVSRMASGDLDAQREMMRLVAALRLSNGDPSILTNSVGRYMREIAGGHVLDIMYNSILSGPRTHMVNTLSSAINTILRPTTAFIGGDWKTKKAALASFYSFHTTLAESWKMASQVMRNNGRAINDGGKDMVRMAEIDAKMEVLRRTADVSGDWQLKAGVRWLEILKDIAQFPLFDWPGKLMTTTDEFFKTMVARMEFHSRNMQAAIDASADSGEPVEALFESLLKNNLERTFDPETGRILDPTLLNTAKEITFQTDLEGTARMFGAMVNAMPLNSGRLFFPFVKTGHNIAVYTASHVPLLNLLLKEYRQVMKGDDAYLQAVYKGRVALGSMLMLGAGLAVQQGMITGNGPPNKNDRVQWLAKNPARSINLTRLTGGAVKGEGDKDMWIDYSRIEPFGQLISAMADGGEIAARWDLEPDKVEYLSGYLTYAVAMNMTNKSYLQGLVPLGQLLTPGWQGAAQLVSVPFQALNNYVPMSGMRRAVANSLNPYLQEFDNEFQRLSFHSTFGLTKKHYASDWLTGEPIWNQTGGIFNNLSPLAVQYRGRDVVKDKLEDIGFDSQIVIKEMSDVKLNREQRAFFLKTLGESGVRESIKKFVTHPSFDEAVKAYKDSVKDTSKPVRYKENEYWYREIVRRVRQYRAGAIERTMDEFPELRSQMYTNMNTKIDQQRLESPQVEYNLDALTNPYLQ